MSAKKNEGNPLFDYLYGISALETAHYDKAVFALERVIINQPNIIRPRLELARAYMKINNDPAALREFKQVLSLNPPVAVQRNVNRYIQKNTPILLWNDTGQSGIGSQYRQYVDGGYFYLQYLNASGSWANVFRVDPSTGIVNFSLNLDSPNWDEGGDEPPTTPCVCDDSFTVVGSQPLIFWELEGTSIIWAIGVDPSGTVAFGNSRNGGSTWTGQFYTNSSDEFIFNRCPHAMAGPTASTHLTTKSYVDYQISLIPEPSNYFANFISITGASSARVDLDGSGAIWRINADYNGMAIGTPSEAWMGFLYAGIYCYKPTYCNNIGEGPDALVNRGYVTDYVASQLKSLEDRIKALEEK